MTRGFIAAAAVALAIPALTVVWLGWLLLRSDKELDRQRVQERLDAAAGLVVGALDRALATADQRLALVAGATGTDREEAASAFQLSLDDGVVVVLEAGETWSSSPLPWYPGDADLPDDPAQLDFLEAEALEFRGDLATAATAYQALSRSREPDVRAGALARVARVARKRGQLSTALAAYEQLASMSGTMALGRPADLLARAERLALLQSMAASPGAGRDGSDGRDRSPSGPSPAAASTQLAADSRALDEALLAGRWRLTRSQFDFYRSRLTAHAPTTVRVGLAGAVSSIPWAVESAGEATTGGRVPWAGADGRGFVVWRRVGSRVAALAVTDAWLGRTWLAEARAIARGQRARVSLSTSDGAEWLDTALSGPALRRSAADTGLPFTVRVASTDPTGDTSTFAGRRRLLAGIVAALALLMVGAGYVAARGLAREVAAARLQSDFVAAVSHEFRTPVASVRQLVELLDEGRVADDTKRHEYYGRIRRQATRLQRLVENLLDFGRMEAGADEYRMVEIDPADLVHEVTHEFGGDGRGSGRQVEVVVAEPLPPIVGDREALGRALWNLLDNAAKYSPADAPIVVEAREDEAGIAIRVRDQGPGIPPDEQPRIFDKFVRGAQARESGAKGSGLGLAMVRHIVEAHGGRVSVESTLGHGSTFTMTLHT